MENPAPTECLKQGSCRECISRKLGVFMTKHHRFHPASSYRTKIEQQFRNHPDNIDNIPWCEHVEHHATTKPPQKPPVEHMRAFLLRNIKVDI